MQAADLLAASSIDALDGNTTVVVDLMDGAIVLSETARGGSATLVPLAIPVGKVDWGWINLKLKLMQ